MLVDPRRSSKPQPTLVDRTAGVLRVKPGEKQEFDSMQLNDVAVVITGGGSGLGAATARARAAKGARDAVLDVCKE